MCGISGSITWKNTDGAALERSDISKLAYRGPDALCVVRSAELPRPPQAVHWKLEHARLSILDLAATANQPMCSADQRYWLVFNGEIYNHRPLRVELERLGHTFRTDHSDTEVLLNACIAWGLGCLERLNGMFAFVFVDNVTGIVLGARDRMGIKPFYYTEENGVFAFASEPKALAAPRTADRASLLGYFDFLQIDGARTFYSAIRKLPAAHCFEIRPGEAIQPRRYWHPLGGGDKRRDLADPSSCFALLQESVALQLEADVEVGTYLSGGLDSSVIAALASRDRRINTFSIGFDDSVPGYVSELPYARMVSDHLNTRHHTLAISPAEYLAAQERAFSVLDEPIADSACGPLLLLSELARANGVTVCLSGEGSDELFIGYRHWHDAYRVSAWLQRIPTSVIRAYLAMGAPVLGRRKPDWITWAKRAAQGRTTLWGGIDAMSRETPGDIFSREFLSEAHDPYATVQAHMELAEMRGADFLQRLSAFDLQFRLPENLLARVDRMSMAASVEARVPYLDHRLVEQAMRIPVERLVSAKGEKVALKEFARTYLPHAVIDRRKDGFTIPMNEVLNTREAIRQKDLILGMDDALRMYSRKFREQLAAGAVTGRRLWPHYALAKWWSLHVR